MKTLSTGLLTLSLLCTGITATPTLHASTETGQTGLIANSEDPQKIQAEIDKLKQGPQNRTTLRKITVFERKLEALKINSGTDSQEFQGNSTLTKEMMQKMDLERKPEEMNSRPDTHSDDPQKIQAEIDRLKQGSQNRTTLKKISDLEIKLESLHTQ